MIRISHFLCEVSHHLENSKSFFWYFDMYLRRVGLALHNMPLAKSLSNLERYMFNNEIRAKNCTPILKFVITFFKFHYEGTIIPYTKFKCSYFNLCNCCHVDVTTTDGQKGVTKITFSLFWGHGNVMISRKTEGDCLIPNIPNTPSTG